MRFLLSFILVLAAGSPVSGSDEIPRRVLLDQSEYVGRQAKLFEDIYYLWLHVKQLDRERAEWRFGFDEVTRFRT